MATLEILEILGIRSFGPVEPQKLQFISPVTLIHGPNGTGKTTVIECLRYATTGDQPPNTKGGAFLYDPKLCDESTIKAQVKLQFRCVSGQQNLVSRSQQASIKGKSVTVKTVDTALKRKLKNGETVALDSRCADINAEMKHALGVSAPILQNVIFCHQEESNWPLSEGRALKQKFDDIFASTRYVKALDSITKIRKEKGQNLKVQQAELKGAISYKNRAEEIQEKKARAEKELKTVTETYTEVVEELKPVEEKIEKMLRELENINQITIELVKKKNTHGLLVKDAQEIKDGLKGNLFNGSKAGLEQALQEFESEMSQKNVCLEKLQGKLDHDNRSIQKLVEAEKQLLGVHGKFKQQQERHNDSISKRDETVRDLVRDYNLSGFKSLGSDLSQGHIEKFNKQIKEKEEAIAETTEREKAAFDLRDQELQKSLDDSRQRKSQLETTSKLTRERVSTNKAQIRSLSVRLTEVEASSGRLDHTLVELSRTESELKEVVKSVDLPTANADIAKLQKEKGELDLKLRQLKEELSVANSQTKERTSLDMLRDSKKGKEDQMARIKEKIHDTVEENLGEFPTSNLKRRVDDSLTVMAEEIKTSNSKLSELKMELHSLETKQSTTRERLSSCEQNVNNIKSKVTAECEISQFDETLSQLASDIAAAQDNRGLLHGVKEMFARYYSMLTDANRPKCEQKCPLCKRPFSEEEEVDELANELDRHVQGLPARMEKSERELDRLQSRQERLQHLVPQIHQLRDLEKELPTYRTDIFDIGKQIDEKKSTISKLDGDAAMRLDDEDSLKAIVQDVYKMDQLQIDISQLDEKIANQESMLSGLESTRNVSEISDDQDDVQMRYDTVTMSVERQQKKVTQHNDAVQRLRSKVNDLNADKLKIQQGVQEKCKLEEQKASLSTENSKLQQELEDLGDQLRPFDREIDSIVSEKRSVRNEKDNSLAKLSQQRQQLTSKLSQLNAVQSDIDRYVTDKKADELLKTEGDLEKLREKTRECEGSKENHSAEINELNKQLSEQKIRERELKDNLRYRGKVEEAEECARHVVEINARLGGLDSTRLVSKRDELIERQEELRKKKATTIERQRNWEEQLSNFCAELNAKELRDARQIYLSQSSALEVNKLVVKDLDKYHKALEKAITEYHKNKMVDLNRIIRNLWKETYRGNDIDYIEICSDDATSAAGNEGDVEAVDISKRKTYNYRVVMVRSGTQMDMRGRCSAGQKVLASLIIRLALAETFCLSCGILALDEPTTNLDVENIESLALALSEIIRSRETQRNFQLIIITHDTQFVEILGRRIGVEQYYKIGKNISGQSVLKRSNIDEIVY